MRERPSTAALLAVYRRSIEPDADRLAALWCELSDGDRTPRVLPAPSPPPRTWSHRSLALVVLAAAAAILITVWLGATRSATLGESPAPHLAEQSTVPADAPGGPTVQRDAPEPNEHPEGHVESGATGDREADDPPRSTPVRPAARDRRPSAPPRPKEATTPTSLAEETALIREAEARLREGDPAAALAALARHARRFPRGALVIERRALQAIAWCSGGDRASGRKEAALLRPYLASRPYRDRIERACAE